MDVVTAVSDNTRPTWSKTFQDFGIFFDFNQTVTIGSNESLRHMFSPSHICGFSGFGSSRGTISFWESKLAMFQ